MIDNCSTDDTTKLIEKKYPEVMLIRSEDNLGFGKANNLGISKAIEMGASHLFLMNQDARVAPDTIQKLADVICTRKDIGIISPVHLNWSGDKLDFRFSSYIRFSGQKSRNSDFIPLSFVNAAFWMVPSEVFNIVGGFDTIFYHYGEDIDWINRCCYWGFVVGYCPNAIAYHDREFRVISREMSTHLEFVQHLSFLKDINRSLYSAVIHGYGGLLSKIFESLIFKPKEILSYISIFRKLVSFLPKSLKHRKLCVHSKGTPVFIVG